MAFRSVLAVMVVLASIAVSPPVGAAPVPYEPYTYLDLQRPGVGPVGVADPSVIRIGSTWYLFGTSSADGYEMWSSTDLATWTYGGLVWTPTPGSWNDEGSFWAPEMRFDGTEVWMYYTANERIGVAKADSPEGPFVDVLPHPLVGAGHGGVGDGTYTGGGGLLEDNDEKSIDAFLLETTGGDLFLYITMYTPLSVLAVIPMSDPVTPSGPPQVVLDVELGTWEGFIREAPYVVEHEGTFHLMYSGQGANSPCYSVGVATAPSPTGPFTRRADNPILRQAPAESFWGPGHHGLVEGADGELLMFFHTKREGNIGYDRGVRYAPVSFDDQGRIVLDPPPPGAGTPIQDECIFRQPAPTTDTAPAPPSGPVVAAPTFTG